MTTISLYTLTENEQNKIQSLNESLTNTLLIMCNYGEYVGVSSLDLQDPIYSEYLDLVGPFNLEKIVEVSI